MICPNCHNKLSHTDGTVWFYCINSECKFMRGYDYRVGIHINQKDFLLPLPKYLIAIGSYKNNYIKIGNVDDGFFSNKSIIKIPYFPPNLADLNLTINKISSLVIFI